MSFGLVGYLHYASIDGARCRQFEPRSGVAIGSAGWRYCQKQLAQAFPKDWTADPYFLCVLLALAQMEERKLLGLSKPIIYTPRLIVTSARDHEYIHLYETEITPELLNGLRDPENATQPLRCTIRRKRISYKPYDSFASRLIAELNNALSHCPSDESIAARNDL
ncbi:hypothetical protein N7461_006663 [Penicillium sp. DV-2018c]|nr:hypothetical protein N7461_006663 [Penicillium sp. DV-2018c]